MPSDALALFEASLSKTERKIVSSLKSPAKIQAYLDALAYRTEDCYCCPLRVLREQRAHCFDGALFAAAMLRRIGYPPLIVDLSAYRDDGHILAIYKRDGHFGALAKSNFVGLRYREPVYRSLRELVMSYFEDYYNVEGIKSLRSYTLPLNLKRFDRFQWMTRDEHLDKIADRLDAVRRVPLLTPQMIAKLSPLDQRSYKAGMVGTDLAGVYQPR
jgi:hypothetical protein